MRPDEILERIVSAKLHADFEPVRGREGALLTNRVDIVAQLDGLRGVPGMNRRAEQILNLLPTNPTDPINNVHVDRMNTLIQETNRYRSNLIELLTTIYDNEPENAFYIRLPDNALTTPQEFVRCFDDLVTRLDEICSRIASHGISIGGVRHGSAWIQILAAPAAATSILAVIVTLVKLYYWCRIKDAECRKLLAEAKTTEAGLRLQEGLVDMFDQLKHKQATNMLTALHSNNTRANLHENVNLGLGWITKLTHYSNSNAKIMLSAKAGDAIKSELPVDAGGYLSELPADLVPELKALKVGTEDLAGGKSGSAE